VQKKKNLPKATRYTYTRDMEITRHILDAYASVKVNSQLDTLADLLTNIHWMENHPSFRSRILYRWWNSGSWPRRSVWNHKNTYNTLIPTYGCAISEVIKCHSPTMEDRFRSQKSPCGIRVGHSVSGTSCRRVLYFPASVKWKNDNYIPPIFQIHFSTTVCTTYSQCFAN